MTRWITAEEVPGLLSPGATVFVQSAAAEPRALLAALARAPEASAGVTYVHFNVPGVNRTDFAALHPAARMTAFFATRDLHGSIDQGKVRLMLCHLSATYDYLCRRERFDLALVQVAPPDPDGLCSFGVSADVVPDVLNRAHVVVAEVNRAMPRAPGAPRLPLDRIDYAVEADHPLIELRPPAPSAEYAALGRNVASLVEDGDTLELGIGAAPAAVLAALKDRRDLGIHTGLLTDPVVDLVEGGAVTGKRKSIDRGRIITGVAIGTKRLYDFIGAGAPVDFKPICYTHDPRVLGQIERFVAINTVLEVDLLGQANAEMIAGRPVSGIGGLADFVRGARTARGGRSILALLSTADGGAVSRIVPALATGTVVSIPRADADYVVTEHGVASLREASLDERAQALIAVAAPAFRDRLADEWGRLRRSAVSP